MFTHPLLVPLNHLPVAKKARAIFRSVCGNRVTIVTAPTGQGKTLYVSLMLMVMIGKIIRSKWLSQVIVTEPRRLACRSAATYLCSLLGLELGQLIGFKTAYPEESCYSAETKLIYCTDGLQAVRELLNINYNRAILVIDEIHEWNIYMEILVAWAKKKLQEGAKFRLVIMSATMNAEALSGYFWDAPIICSNERKFNVTQLKPGASIHEDVKTQVMLGHSVLVFEPGKEELYSLIAELKQMGLDAEILPLHGELTVKEQNRCFEETSRPKVIVATPIAQTSVTPPIVGVIDTGTKREVRHSNKGVDALLTVRCSKEDEEQRRGRAGRTKDGFYISHAPRNIPAPECSVPEIQRISLESAALRIFAAGHDPDMLEFFHSPVNAQGKSGWAIAKQTLVRLGCLTRTNNVTSMGELIAKMPTSVQLGRAIVESLSLGIRDDMIAIAAIISVGGITQRGNLKWQDWVTQNISDAVAALQVYKKACAKLDGAKESGSEEEAKVIASLEEIGIDMKSLRQAQQLIRKLDNCVPPQYVKPFRGETHHMDALRQALAKGFLDHIYVRVGKLWVNGDSHQGRELPNSSVIDPDEGSLIYLVGLPFDINTDGDDPDEATNIITWATLVTPDLVPPEIKKMAKRRMRKLRKYLNGKSRAEYHQRQGGDR